MKKINLILLSLVAAIPAGYLVYLMVMALTLKHIWDKKILGGMVVTTAFFALLVAVWPPIYAIAFYTEKPKEDEDEPPVDGEVSKAEGEAEAEEFPEEDLDAFEGQEVAEADELADDDFETADAGSEFDLEDDVPQAETAEFAIADDFEEIEDLEEDFVEEAPKKKPKKKKK